MLAFPRNSGRQGFPVAKLSGFTLVELLTVIAIIMILAGIVVGVQRGVYSSQANAKARGEIQAIATALEQYKSRYGTYPKIVSSDGKKAVNAPKRLFDHLTGKVYSKYTPPASGTGQGTWKDESVTNGTPFIDVSQMTVDNKENPTQFNDPWGRAYVYMHGVTDEDNDEFGDFLFILYSKGPTNEADGDGVKLKNHASQKLFFDDKAAANQPTRKDNIVFGLEYNP